MYNVDYQVEGARVSVPTTEVQVAENENSAVFESNEELVMDVFESLYGFNAYVETRIQEEVQWAICEYEEDGKDFSTLTIEVPMWEWFEVWYNLLWLGCCRREEIADLKTFWEENEYMVLDEDELIEIAIEACCDMGVDDADSDSVIVEVV